MLQDAKVVVIVARDCDDSFESNAPVMTELAVQICNHCPDVTFLIKYLCYADILNMHEKN